jgi:IS1 family transposase
MPNMWITAVQEKWPYLPWQTKSLLQSMCERHFSASANPAIIPHEQRPLIESFLRGRISLRGICHAVGVNLTWLLHFMVECFAACPDHLHVELPSDPRDVWIYQLEAEADEAWSFVERKANKQWIWLAMDTKSRQIIVFHVGGRSRGSTQALWASIPAVYQQHAKFHTDQYAVYTGVIPAEQHKAITKEARKTNLIELQPGESGSITPT